MTFIRSHAEALRRHTAVYAGAHRLAGLSLPVERTVSVNEGGPLGVIYEAAFRNAGYAPRFMARLKGRSPVIVHTHFGDSGPTGQMIAERLGIPSVLTFHGRDATITDRESRHTWRGRAYLRHRPRLIASTDIVIAVSNYIKGRLVAQGFDERRLVTHYNGIDTNEFVPLQNEREPIALFVGRFVEKKGCRYMLEALARLRWAGTPVRSVLIGEGPLKPELERFAAEQALDAEFIGLQSMDGVRTWMNRARVVVVPSVTADDGDSEGLPTVILEAQAMATPVITTVHSGNPEGVKDGETAILIAERDTEALAAALHCLVSNADRSRSMGHAGRRFVQERFSLDQQVAGLEHLYDQAAENYRRSRADKCN